MSFDVVPAFELIDVDRIRLGCKVQQEVDVKFSLSFGSDDCRKPIQREKTLDSPCGTLITPENKSLVTPRKPISSERTYDIIFSACGGG